jgi:preprotein translocase subunit SecE
VSSDYITLLVWVVVIAGLFAYLWWRGDIVRLRNYVLETREELKKCTWPSMTELKGSTVVVLISVLMLGIFTVVVDYVLLNAVNWITRI